MIKNIIALALALAFDSTNAVMYKDSLETIFNALTVLDKDSNGQLDEDDYFAYKEQLNYDDVISDLESFEDLYTEYMELYDNNKDEIVDASDFA